MKVYVVFMYDGYDYSGPLKVFDSREKAENYIKGDNDYEIEELELQ